MVGEVRGVGMAVGVVRERREREMSLPCVENEKDKAKKKKNSIPFLCGNTKKEIATFFFLKPTRKITHPKFGYLMCLHASRAKSIVSTFFIFTAFFLLQQKLRYPLLLYY